MEKDLLGYLMKALDPAEQAAVEAHLRTQPEAQAQLETLRQTLEPLAWDPPEAPPSELAARTLARLATSQAATVPATTNPGWRGFRPGRRFVEMAVAAVVALIVAGTVTVWITRARQQQTPGGGGEQQLVECKDNLRKLYIALHAYSDTHGGKYPSVASAAAPPRNVAALVYPMLYDAKNLPADVSWCCPAGGMCGFSPNGMREIREMTPDAFESWALRQQQSYAYTLGYRSNGQLVGMRMEEGKPHALMPLMADSAPLDPKAGTNSPHHGGQGQNVLFCDGHVAFFCCRTAGFQQDDIYLNRNGKVAAGLDWTDTVLSSSLATP
jgi:prepilin-type processing-associated H-X9-DG protein